VSRRAARRWRATCRIAEHGLIGDLHTVALVGTDGTIDWHCPRRVDAPSVFASLLDADRGGRFRIEPEREGWTSKQLYLPDTNVLITRFLTPDGVGEVHDFMSPRSGEAPHRQRIVRRVLAVRGEMRFAVEVAPRFDYARAGHEVALTPNGALFSSADLSLGLSARQPLEIVDGRDVRASFDVRAGETASFVLGPVEHGEAPPACSEAEIDAELGAHAQAPHLRAQRRDRRRPHHQPAGGAGRRPQLGLPLHLDARLRLHRLRAAAARLPRGGHRLHGLSATARRPSCSSTSTAS